VDRADDARNVREHGLLLHVALGKRLPGDPAGDQAAMLGHVGHDLGADAGRGRVERRLVLGGAVDAQERGVLVRQA
jgi:hypothetical protein